MTQPFVVLGYPKSRLPWLSVFLTAGSAICQAEVNRLMWDLPELKGMLEGEYTHMGVADSTLGVFATRIYEEICPRILVIERDPEEVERIQHDHGMPVNNYVRLMEAEFENIRGREGVLFLPFDQLRERKTVERAFRHCLPGLAFDELRWDSLSEMYIDMDPILMGVKLDSDVKRIGHLLRDVLPKLLVAKPDASLTH